MFTTSDCGSNALSLSTSNPNPSVDQSLCCCCGGDGGAGNASSILNAIGKWGSAITAQVQGKAVAVTNKGVTVGAAGSSTLPGQFSANTLILIVVLAGALIFLATRK